MTLKNTILLASKNKSKIADFKLYIGNEFILKTPFDFNSLSIDIKEGITSIEENALMKAQAYAKATGLISLADDTGFFINELNGEPGVALRRWGGELPDGVTQAEFWKYLQMKTMNLETITCYFKQCIAIVAPNGAHRFVYSKNNGILNKEKLKGDYNGSDYPLAQAFESKNRKLTWDEMTDDQKKAFDKQLIIDLHQAIQEILTLPSKQKRKD